MGDQVSPHPWRERGVICNRRCERGRPSLTAASICDPAPGSDNPNKSPPGTGRVGKEPHKYAEKHASLSEMIEDEVN